MRVIAGKYKGCPLKAVRGVKTRPTTDKVKEALFSMIGPFFDGGRVLDLFAGSGALALEALSRGCDYAVLVDRASAAINTIKQNINALKITDQTFVFRNEAIRALKFLHKKEQKFEIVFLDPPYKKDQLEKTIKMLENLQLVKNETIIVCEHAKEVTIAKEIGQCLRMKTTTYGTTALSIYKYKKGASDAK